ncbi:MAG: aldolase [Burkholderiaceae bacterium]|jgi:ribulose-5-phosphate 4-epimerase/fuculose-1-phosphate aldolase|nr:aldolase [Burkholderiaceae bacterium]
MPLPTTLADAARADLACALRAADEYGLGEGVCNHFSLALPDGSFLINPQGLSWREITPDDLVTIDAQGRRLAGRHPVEPTAFFIHGWIHRVAPQATCVLHTHMPYATALTMLDGGRLQMAHQNALRFFDAVAYDTQYNGLVLDDAEAERIARKLAAAPGLRVLFLANHGVIVTGPTVAWAFDDLYYLERACMHQLLAMHSGLPLKRIPEHIASRTARQMDGERQQSDLHLAMLRRRYGWD